MIVAILSILGRTNLMAAVAILFTLALRYPTRKFFGARCAYALWIITPAMVAASLLPATSDTFASPVFQTVVSAAARLDPTSLSSKPALLDGLFALWLAGALATAGIVLRRQAQFIDSLGRLEPMSPAQPWWLRAEHPGVGPAVVGTWRPRIVTPPDFEARFDPNERAMILAHENCHLAHGHATINGLIVIAQCVSWFNPLVHFAAYVLRTDQELACDESVLNHFPSNRRLYGEMLLKTQLAHQSPPLGCHWPARSEHPLKQRIALLNSPPRPATRSAIGLLMIATLGLLGACAAWAAQPFTDFSGAWNFAGDIKAKGAYAWTKPMCFFKQSGDQLLGTCKGPNSRGPAKGTTSGQRITWRWDHRGYTSIGLSGESTFVGILGADKVVRGTWSYSGLPGQNGNFTGQRQ